MVAMTYLCGSSPSSPSSRFWVTHVVQFWLPRVVASLKLAVLAFRFRTSVVFGDFSRASDYRRCRTPAPRKRTVAVSLVFICGEYIDNNRMGESRRALVGTRTTRLGAVAFHSHVMTEPMRDLVIT